MLTYRARLLTPRGPDAALYLHDAVVEVDAGGRLTHVGPFDGRSVDEDLRPGLLTPGFVDAHLHLPQTRIIGAASGPLLPWLEGMVFPEEARFSQPEHARAVAARFVAALGAAGTTTAFVYGSVHPAAAEIMFEALDQAGLRAIAGPVLMDRACPPELVLGPDRCLPALEALAERWHGHDRGRLQVAVIPRFAISCTPELLAGAGALAQRLDLPISTHLSENPDECRFVTEGFGAPDYLSVYEDAGLVRPGAIFAHCIHLSESEWERLARAGAVVAHCPDSNRFLGSGAMDIAGAVRHGVALAIGTDVAAGRTFRIPRILSAAYDNARQLDFDISPARLLWLGTRGGACALGLTETGSLTPGLDADMTLHEQPPWCDDKRASMAALLFDHDSPPRLRTWVRGREVWRR